MAGVDFDSDVHSFGVTGLEWGDDLDGPFGHAATAYRRECGWDFSPGEAGIWLVMLAPVSGMGFGDEPWTYTGHLIGFAILYDRDGDAYRSVGHVWTASAWRRRGIARRLLSEARSRFAFEHIEGPYTEDGAALVKTIPPDRNPPKGT
jgi:ribosomal protein S18 acetylase RimI-like enzyme